MAEKPGCGAHMGVALLVGADGVGVGQAGRRLIVDDLNLRPVRCRNGVLPSESFVAGFSCAARQRQHQHHHHADEGVGAFASAGQGFAGWGAGLGVGRISLLGVHWASKADSGQIRRVADVALPFGANVPNHWPVTSNRSLGSSPCSCRLASSPPSPRGASGLVAWYKWFW